MGGNTILDCKRGNMAFSRLLPQKLGVRIRFSGSVQSMPDAAPIQGGYAYDLIRSKRA